MTTLGKLGVSSDGTSHTARYLQLLVGPTISNLYSEKKFRDGFNSGDGYYDFEDLGDELTSPPGANIN